METFLRNVVVVGASRGIGAAVCEGLIDRCDGLITVSRSAVQYLHNSCKTWKNLGFASFAACFLLQPERSASVSSQA